MFYNAYDRIDKNRLKLKNAHIFFFCTVFYSDVMDYGVWFTQNYG